MSQTTVAKALGVTFQQIQKYEKGVNRISAGRLYLLARFLGGTVADFFEGLIDEGTGANIVFDDAALGIQAFMSSQEGITFIQALMAVKNRRLRKDIFQLLLAVQASHPK